MTDPLYTQVWNSNVLVDPLEQAQEEFSSMPDNTLKLFEEGANDDVTLRSQLNEREVVLANAIQVDNEFLKQDLQNFDLFGPFLKNFKRHKVSLNRQSRSEFVDINRKNRFDQELHKFANIKNLVEPRN